MAEKIIFTYAVARGSNTVESKDLEDTWGYKFQHGFGIIQGLELYCPDMEFNGKLSHSYLEATGRGGFKITIK